MSLFEQKSLLAKLMATENMHIRQGNVATASFDVKNRVLTVPILDNNLTKEVYDLFMGHECHALWTPLEGMKKAREQKLNMSVLNVVEDSRIERRIKNKYPGIKAPFVTAYNYLFVQDFFETEDKDLSELNFIDRVNLHCKVGAVLALPFTEEERNLLNEVESTDTFDEVIEVTKKICEFMKNELIEQEEEKQKIKIAVIVDGEDDEGSETPQKSEEKLEDFDEVIDARSEKQKQKPENEEADNEVEEGSGEKGASSGLEGGIDLKAIEEQIRSFTDDAYKRNEENLFSKGNNKYIYANVPKFDLNTIMDYKDMMKWMEVDDFRVNIADFNRYKRESSKVVSYLVKEFELRKNADQMKRASTAKTGDLNMNRLYSYQFTEDIFKKITVMPQGQSHGLVMFLDWSGSMINHISNTTKQLLNLVLFCKKVNIPFEVYAFVDGTKSQNTFRQKAVAGDMVMAQFGLINLLSSRMSSKDFTHCASALMKMSGIGVAQKWNYRTPSFMQMSGTPLNETVIAAMEIVPEFQKKNRLQIVNTVFLTDGEGSSCHNLIDTSGYPIHKPFSHMVIRDPKTRHEEVFDRNSQYYTKQTDCLIRLLKLRTNSHVIGFFVGSTKDITNRIGYFFPEYSKLPPSQREDFREKLKNDFRKNSSIVINATGFDDYYLLRSDGLDTDDNTELEFGEKSTTRGMASAFSKYAGNKIASRVVLNRFIELIS